MNHCCSSPVHHHFINAPGRVLCGGTDVLVIQYPAEFPSLLRTTLYALLAATAFVRGRRTLRTHVVLADGAEEAAPRKKTR